MTTAPSVMPAAYWYWLPLKLVVSERTDPSPKAKFTMFVCLLPYWYHCGFADRPQAVGRLELYHRL